MIISIKQKINLFTTFIVLLTVIIVSTSSFFIIKKLVKDREIEHLSILLDNNNIIIQQYFNDIDKDISFLAQTNITKEFSKNTQNDHVKDYTINLLKEFLKSKPEYFQIRYIDNKGQELIRVNKDKNDNVYTTPEDKLQNKSKRYYFIEAMNSDSSLPYHSAIDLNVENEEIEKPYRATTRVASKIINDNLPVGIIVINVDLSKLIQDIKNGFDHLGQIMLTNNNGYYLIHPLSQKTFSFMFDKEYKIQNDYPELRDIFNENINFYWNLGNNKHLLSSEGKLLISKKVNYNLSNKRDFLLFTLLSEDNFIYYEYLKNTKSTLFLIATFILIISLITSTMLIKYILKPLEQIINLAKNYDKGSFTSNLPDSSSDEFNILSKALIDMHNIIEERSIKLEMHKNNLEIQVGNKTKEISNQLDEIRELSKTRENFIKSINNDLKTPINGIIGMLTLLKKTKPTDKQKEYLKALENSALLLSELINKLLNFSNIKHNKLELINDPINLKNLVEEVLEITEATIHPTAELLLIWEEELKPYVITDKIKLRTVLLNLLSNACNFTTEGTITLKISSIRIKYDTATYQFIISDTGSGIKEDKLQKLNSQIEAEYKKNEPSIAFTWSRLCLCVNVLKAMNSRLNIYSEENKGTTVKFNIEFKTTDESKAALQSIEDIDFKDIKGKKALIADDSRVNLLTLSTLLEEYGLKVTTANDGYEAINKFNEDKFDVIFMDCQMPNIDGFEATKTIRDIEKINNEPKTPIIAITANSSEKDKEECEKSGMNYCMSKPIEEYTLIEVLKKWIKAI